MDEAIILSLRQTNTSANRLIKLLDKRQTLARIVDATEDEVDQDDYDTSDPRDTADQLLTDLLDSAGGYACYLRNGQLRATDDKKTEIVVAIDTFEESNQKVAKALGDRALVLVGLEKSERYGGPPIFLLTDVVTRSRQDGGRDAWCMPARIHFVGRNGGLNAKTGFPPAAAAELAKLPIPNAKAITIEQRSKDWRAYLDFLQKLARQSQFAVRYDACRLEHANSKLRLFLRASVSDADWRKILDARNDNVHISEGRRAWATDLLPESYVIDPDKEDLDDDWNAIQMGTIISTSRDAREVHLDLDENTTDRISNGALKVPSTGWLIYMAGGDMAQAKRLSYGLETLKKGRAQNPRLSEFLFDAKQAGPTVTENRVKLSTEDLLQSGLADNPEQFAAVEGALNAPDLFLIQGPPGTGKTTVIAEICYQVARRGGRTLIASQANLAVDNAMSRLVHHQSIRALRRGRPDRVEVEGAPYLEDNVINTWLAGTAGSCRRDLDRRKRRIEMLQFAAPHIQTVARVCDDAVPLFESMKAHSSILTECDQQIQRIEDQLRGDEERRKVCRWYLDNAGVWRRWIESDGSSPRPTISLGLRNSRNDAELIALGGHFAQLHVATAGLLAELGKWNTDGSTQPDWSAFHDIDQYLLEARRAAKLSSNLSFNLATAHTLLSGIVDTLEQRDLWQRRREERRVSMEWHRQRHAIAASELAKVTTKKTEVEKGLAEVRAFIDRVSRSWEALDAWVSTFRTGEMPIMDSLPLDLLGRIGRQIWPVTAGELSAHAVPQTVRAARNSQAKSYDPDLQALSEAARDVLSELSSIVDQKELKKLRGSTVPWRESLGQFIIDDGSGGFTAASRSANGIRDFGAQLMREAVKKQGLVDRIFQPRAVAENTALWVICFQSFVRDCNAALRQFPTSQTGSSATTAPTPSSAATLIQNAALREARNLARDSEAKLLTLIDEIRGLDAEREAATRALSQADSAYRETKSGYAEIEGKWTGLMLSASQSSTTEMLVSGGSKEIRSLTVSDVPDLIAILRELEDSRTRILSLAQKVDALATFDAYVSSVIAEEDRISSELGLQRAGLETFKLRRSAAVHQLDERRRELARQRPLWRFELADVPSSLFPLAGSDLNDAEVIQALATSAAALQNQLAEEQAYMQQCGTLVEDWISRLDDSSSQDMSDLRRVYIDNANVVGITCVQAGKKDFSEEFRNFDYVIIDEVSKATPPELLLPMLKGSKIVLVGDHKQLPPMIGTDTIQDLAMEIGSSEEALSHLKRSLFKELFEQCPQDLKRMLKYQYRMHPQIMAAINQFYSSSLECRIHDPDVARAHGCDGAIKSSNHIVWYSTPLGLGNYEEKVGTSYRNLRELEIIEKIVGNLDRAWGAERDRDPSKPRKEVAVITFYAAQANELRRRLAERSSGDEFRHLKLRTGTVDRFQGMERAIVIVSFVRNNTGGDIGFAREPERVNVALSRAQELLVMVGARELFCDRASSHVSRELYSRVSNVVRLAEGFYDLPTLS